MKKPHLLIPGLLLCCTLFFSCRGKKPIQNGEKEKSEQLQQSIIWLESAIPGEQSYVVFRKEFLIEKDIEQAEIRLFADSRYMLWINGEYVERGPCRFDVNRPEYDMLSIGEYLKKGENTIAILVHHYAISSFTVWHDKSARIMHNDPGLTALVTVFSEDGETESLITDTSWKASKRTRFMPSPGSYSSIPDNIDARLDKGDWTLSTFDDTGWKNASAVQRNNWGKLYSRSIPLLREQEIVPREICQTIIEGDTINQTKSLSEKLPLKMKAADQIVIDVGETVQAYSVLDFDAEEGSKIEIEYATLFHQNGNKPFKASFTGDNINARYIAKAGFQRYMGGDTYGFKYMVIKVINGKIELKGVKVVDRKYPNTRVGKFTSNDTVLNELWKVCVKTVEACSEDSYVDCADRERAQWLADGYKMNYPVSRVTLATEEKDGKYVYADPRLLKNMLRHMAFSQLPDGRLQPMRPSDLVPTHRHGVIDDYSCLWIHALGECVNRTDDLDFLNEMWPYARKTMDYFLKRTTVNGLVHAGEFVYFDNPLRYKKCEGATINAYIYGALRDMANLAGKLGDTEEERRYSNAADKLYSSFNEHLWNSGEQNYYGAIISEEPVAMVDDPPTYSEPYEGELIDGIYAPSTPHAALMALYYNLVPEDKKQKVFDYMLGSNGGPQAWWPYTSRFFLDLLYTEDTPKMDKKALNYIRDSFGHMNDYETGTTSESWTGGTFVHESGSHPAYFMSAYVLGARTEVSNEGLQLIIQPRLGYLMKAEGNVLCEFGEVAVKWEKSINGNLAFSFTVPNKTDALVYLPIEPRALPKELTINKTQHLKNGKSVDKGEIKGNYYVIRLGQGTYSGEVTY